MRGRSQGISSSAFFVLTPNLQRLGFFWCSDSCMHNTKISLPCLIRISESLCCVSLHSKSDRLLLLLRRGSRSREHLQILSADERLSNRRTSQHGFLPQLLQCRDKKPSFIKTKQLTDLRNQKADFLTPLFYLREFQTESQSLGEWNLSDHEQALIDGFRSPLLETHGKNFPQHSPSRIARNAVRTYEALAFPYPAESSAVGNRQRHNGGTHKEHHNLQADALQCQPDNSLTRYTESQIYS